MKNLRGSTRELSLREEHKQLTRLRIMRAARACFLREGVSAVSYDDIAAEAGVSRATLYLYFPNKNSLLGSLLEQQLQETVRIYERLTSLPEVGLADVRAWLAGYVQSVAEHRAVMRLFNAEAALDDVVQTTLAAHHIHIISLLGARFPAFDLKRLRGAARDRRHCEAEFMIVQIERFCAIASRPDFHMNREIGLDMIAERMFAMIESKDAPAVSAPRRKPRAAHAAKAPAKS